MPHIQPEAVQIWFPPALQARYVNHILMQSESQAARCVKLTYTQATHLVRLWGYAYVKHYGISHTPIKALTCRVDSFFCSHSEAANLLYADREIEGTARSAGLMLKTIESMSLIQCKSTKGSPTKIRLNIPLAFELPEKSQESKIFPDKFNPRRDAPTVANFLKVLFHYDAGTSQSLGRDITKVLREWSQRYPDGLRVLRQEKTRKPVAAVTVFPIHSNSESKFDLPPSESLYLHKIRKKAKDPIQFAEPGDPNCYIAYIRCWHIKPGLWNHETVLQFIEETKTMLRQMHQKYPELSDIYSIILHPNHEDFVSRLGFDITRSDPNISQRWAYIALDDFLELKSEELLKDFSFEAYNRLSFT